LVPVIVELIKEIEKIIPEGGKGQEKLEFAHKLLEAGYEEVTTLWPVIEKVIAATVTLLNSTGILKTTK